MFGYPSYFLNGNMFVGVLGDKIFLRLSESGMTQIMNDYKDVFAFEPIPGRTMKGYVVLPKVIYSDDKLFEEWLEKSVKFVSSLPPKHKKKK